MKEDASVVGLRARLVGKTVVSVDSSLLSEHYYLIGTSDGSTFHIGATDLGSWVTDGPRKDGFFPTIKSLASAVDDIRSRTSGYEVPVVVTRSGNALLVDPGEGSTFSISPDSVSDPWEKRVLSHPKAPAFLRKIFENPFFGWAHFFRKDLPPDSMAFGVPPELLLDEEELSSKA